MSCPNPHCRHKTKRRKLRPLVISIIPEEDEQINNTPSHSSRHERILQMFRSHPSLAMHFEPPVFSPGVPSRKIRNRLKLLQYSRRAGLIPDVEWEEIDRALREQTSEEMLKNGMDRMDINADSIISTIQQNQYEVIDPFLHLAITEQIDDEVETDQNNNSENGLKKHKWPRTKTTSLVPIPPGRKGSAEDVTIPYSMELWCKAKSLNRDRSVLACTLAHLIAMKKLVGDGSSDGQDFDFILEDNVRAFVGIDFESANCTRVGDNSNNCWTGWGCECANRIWDIIEMSENVGKDDTKSDNLTTCHLRYFGWLGSLPNLSWVYKNHIPRKGHGSDGMMIFPFPTNDDFALDSIPTDRETSKLLKKSQTKSDKESFDNKPHFETPGGTAVFGTFAYSISTRAYHSLIENLQNDVGALMWKSKKMRAYHAKAIDKILPRHVRATFGEKSVHLPNKVAFVRCPMLGSLLHPQWEEGFCESTELQYELSLANSDDETANYSVWDNVWLTDKERQRAEERNENKLKREL